MSDCVHDTTLIHVRLCSWCNFNPCQTVFEM